MHTLSLETEKKYQLIDITGQVNEIVGRAKSQSGLVTVFVPHTTATLLCNENEAGLEKDLLKVARSVEDNQDQVWGGFDHDHAEGNAHAHVVSSFTGNSLTLIVEAGELILGTWQKIMFLEMDGPRQRKIYIQLVI